MVLGRSSHDLTSLTKADTYQVSGQPLPGLGHHTLALTKHRTQSYPSNCSCLCQINPDQGTLTLSGLSVSPDMSSQFCDGLKAHQAWCTSADGCACLRRIPSKVLTPFQDQPTVQGDPTPFQDQFTAQGDPHTLPGPVYLSEYVLSPLWQNQDYCFKAIYTATLMKLHGQLHE